mmetsp:Transcript_108101/g.282175  ORF Transcript_108101/g.282175 Transcript_108101/m.282175 type:complete len:220 (+) Transcript_108101:55-714(+)
MPGWPRRVCARVPSTGCARPTIHRAGGRGSASRGRPRRRRPAAGTGEARKGWICTQRTRRRLARASSRPARAAARGLRFRRSRRTPRPPATGSRPSGPCSTARWPSPCRGDAWQSSAPPRHTTSEAALRLAAATLWRRPCACRPPSSGACSTPRGWPGAPKEAPTSPRTALCTAPASRSSGTTGTVVIRPWRSQWSWPAWSAWPCPTRTAACATRPWMS